MSEIAALISGVVQGSGIGPLMFLTYINELIYILEELGVKVKLFADDVKCTQGLQTMSVWYDYSEQ